MPTAQALFNVCTALRRMLTKADNAQVLPIKGEETDSISIGCVDSPRSIDSFDSSDSLDSFISSDVDDSKGDPDYFPSEDTMDSADWGQEVMSVLAPIPLLTPVHDPSADFPLAGCTGACDIKEEPDFPFPRPTPFWQKPDGEWPVKVEAEVRG